MPIDDLSSQLSSVPTPAYVLDEMKMEDNLLSLSNIKNKTGCTILLALKAFASPCSFPLISKYLDGVSASSLNEAKLGKEFGKEVHLYSPAYKESEFDELQVISSHIIFNSFSQWRKFKNKIDLSQTKCGIRINPEYSEVKIAKYNPCSKMSRFGVLSEDFSGKDLDGISGLHFHALCEQGSDVLERVWQKVEEKFGDHLNSLSWVNLGGGHFISDDGYDTQKLITLIKHIQSKYNLEVILEPGAAIALRAGYLVSSVLDIGTNNSNFAILDTSATAHMPDVMEMPYVPNIIGSKEPNKYPHNYRLGGVSCLSGDFIGEYSFKTPLEIDDKLIFTDMAQYTIVKNNTFNGIALPSIYLLEKSNKLTKIASFGYEDFVSRLGKV